MAEPVRVLIVDDSVVMRRLLADALGKDPELVVAGTASGGRVALAKLSALKPDVVTLDIEMPDMDGLETLREIRAQWPALRVIMCIGLTERGASITFDALAMGASDYIAKPSHGADLQVFCASLSAKVKAVAPAFNRQSALQPRGNHERVAAGTSRVASAARTAAPSSPGPAANRTRQTRAEVVAIGVSTGGPNALAALLPTLPSNLGVPVVIVQHMPPLFTRLLAERLGRSGHLPVSEAKHGEPLEAGHVYIAPGDLHLVVQGPRLRPMLATHSEAPENSCRPAVDVLFRSVAQLYGPATLAVVLTGMGQDGLKGAELIRSLGGQVLVQDQASSVVWGMPGFIAQAGLADAVLPLNALGAAIVARLRTSRSVNDPRDSEKIPCTPSS